METQNNTTFSTLVSQICLHTSSALAFGLVRPKAKSVITSSSYGDSCANVSYAYESLSYVFYVFYHKA